jgi:transposase-like protein
VIRFGKSSNGKQRYRCLNVKCPYQTFSLNLAHPGRNREVKQQIIEMTLNGSGVRDITRALHVSTAIVINELKKLAQIEAVNQKLLQQLTLSDVEVDIVQVEVVEENEDAEIEEAELDAPVELCGQED